MMYQITNNLYQGPRDVVMNAPPDGNAQDFPFTAVVSLIHPVEQRTPLREGIHHVFLPIDDGKFPGVKWLRTAVSLLMALLANEEKVYVHCRAGISRSSMLVAAYLIKANHWKVDQALEYIAKKNPSIDPNPHFIKGLRQWYNSTFDEKMYNV